MPAIRLACLPCPRPKLASSLCLASLFPPPVQSTRAEANRLSKVNFGPEMLQTVGYMYSRAGAKVGPGSCWRRWAPMHCSIWNAAHALGPPMDLLAVRGLCGAPHGMRPTAAAPAGCRRSWGARSRRWAWAGPGRRCAAWGTAQRPRMAQCLAPSACRWGANGSPLPLAAAAGDAAANRHCCRHQCCCCIAQLAA